jgi:hypothetical protein
MRFFISALHKFQNQQVQRTCTFMSEPMYESAGLEEIISIVFYKCTSPLDSELF